MCVKTVIYQFQKQSLSLYKAYMYDQKQKNDIHCVRKKVAPKTFVNNNFKS